MSDELILDNPRAVSREDARRFQNGKLCCSDCWAPVRASFKWNREAQQTEDTVTCGTPDCPMHGFVSKRFVEQREQASLSELHAAKNALRESIPALKPKRQTTAEVLQELGF